MSNPRQFTLREFLVGTSLIGVSVFLIAGSLGSVFFEKPSRIPPDTLSLIGGVILLSATLGAAIDSRSRMRGCFGGLLLAVLLLMLIPTVFQVRG